MRGEHAPAVERHQPLLRPLLGERARLRRRVERLVRAPARAHRQVAARVRDEAVEPRRETGLAPELADLDAEHRRFTEAGLTNLGIREYSQLRPGEREPFLRNLIGLRLVLTTFGVVVATALTAVTGSPGIVVGGVAITGFGLLVQLTQQTYTVPLNAQLRMGWISILGVIRTRLIITTPAARQA